MQFVIALHGLLIGMLISIPTGPVGFLCVRRALMHDYRASFSSAFGSIAADLIFGAVAIFSLTSIYDFFTHEQNFIRLIGGLLLLYVGIKTFFDIAPEIIPGIKKYEHVGNFASTFFLTMTNPVQIITLPVVFTAVGTGIRASNYGDALFFMIGLGLGACICWMLLIGLASVFRKRVREHHFQLINQVSGTLIVGTGLYILLNLILKWS
jgi:threonine/homoserine/homoserine lactone efflux protein